MTGICDGRLGHQALVVADILSQQALQGRKLVIILVHGPDHHSSQTDIIGPIQLLLERGFVVKAHPLIFLEDDVVHCCILIVNNRGLLILDDILDLEIRQGPRIIRARPLVGRTGKGTARLGAAGVLQLEGSAVES